MIFIGYNDSIMFQQDIAIMAKYKISLCYVILNKLWDARHAFSNVLSSLSFNVCSKFSFPSPADSGKTSIYCPWNKKYIAMSVNSAVMILYSSLHTHPNPKSRANLWHLLVKNNKDRLMENINHALPTNYMYNRWVSSFKILAWHIVKEVNI